MHDSKRALYASVVLAITVIAGACTAASDGGPSPTPPPTARGPAITSAPSGEPAEPTATDGAQPTDDATAAPTQDLPAWMTTPLRAVGTDTDFTIADLRGQLVAIEPMAIWCVNCRQQQREARAALAQLGPDAVFYLSLDVDPNERAAELAQYAVDQEFDWHFAISPPDVSRSLADSFGAQILSPPSTPLIIIAPDGTVVEQHFGFIGADELAQLLRGYAS